MAKGWPPLECEGMLGSWDEVALFWIQPRDESEALDEESSKFGEEGEPQTDPGKAGRIPRHPLPAREPEWPMASQRHA